MFSIETGDEQAMLFEIVIEMKAPRAVVLERHSEFVEIEVSLERVLVIEVPEPIAD